MYLCTTIAIYRTYPRTHYDARSSGKKGTGIGHSSSSGMATSNSSTESLSSKNSIDLAMQKLASLNVSGGELVYMYTVHCASVIGVGLNKPHIIRKDGMSVAFTKTYMEIQINDTSVISLHLKHRLKNR